jgi:hypothetical protein
MDSLLLIPTSMLECAEGFSQEQATLCCVAFLNGAILTTFGESPA